MDQIKTGRFIAALRREHALTQEQLGERLGVTGKTVSRWENGNYMPDISLLQSMAQLFGVRTDELLAGERLSSASPENIQTAPEAVIRSGPFTRREHEQFRKAKWRREHLPSFILCGVSTMALFFLLAVSLDMPVFLFAIPLAACIEYAAFHNRMMIYVESALYDGRTVFAPEAENSDSIDKRQTPDGK